jgi:hypothetical protein
MTSERVQAQVIETAIVWAISAATLLGLLAVGASLLPEGLTALAELKGALANVR